MFYFNDKMTFTRNNGEYSRYDPLDYKSSKVKLNQKVHAGEEISKVGMTGYTYFHTYTFKYMYTPDIIFGQN
jgi:murein DD-endopeptidase MepM/ murein hydrolase activator NlpD